MNRRPLTFFYDGSPDWILPLGKEILYIYGRPHVIASLQRKACFPSFFRNFNWLPFSTPEAMFDAYLDATIFCTVALAARFGQGPAVSLAV